MSHLLTAVLLAMSSNVDNFGVGLAYGVGGRAVRAGHNLLIAAASACGTFVSMAAGEWVNDFMSEACASLVGAALMIAIGLYAVWRAARAGSGRPPRLAPATTTREAALLGLALSLNNLVIGLGAGISHVDIPVTTALTMAASAAAIAGGCRLGRRASIALSQSALGVTAGLIVIAVGIYELFV